MKKLICILLCMCLFLLTGCGSGAENESTAEAEPSDMQTEETVEAVPQMLVNVFGTASDAALAELGLADAEFNEDEGGMVTEYTWCGVPMKTVIDPNWLETGEIVYISGTTDVEAGDAADAFIKKCVQLYTAQFGEPINYSTEICGQGRFGHTYRAESLDDIVADFSALEEDCALTFRFALPGRGEDDLEFAECDFYKFAEASDSVWVNLCMMRLYALDYEVID